MAHDFVTLVSGLPRSGTSMMMRMLEAGGLPVLADHLRTADEDNPEGYYEFERVKKIEHDSAWLEEARGRVVKMISALLKHLPPGYTYKIVFMRRKLEEILASQREMLVRRGKPADATGDARMAEFFTSHLHRVETLARRAAQREGVLRELQRAHAGSRDALRPGGAVPRRAPRRLAHGVRGLQGPL